MMLPVTTLSDSRLSHLPVLLDEAAMCDLLQGELLASRTRPATTSDLLAGNAACSAA